MASVRMLKVALVGLGPIGIEIGRALQAREDVTLVAAADPVFAGKPIGDLVPGAAGVIDPELSAALARGCDVAVLATSSRLAGVAADLEKAIAARVHVVSSCEEMAAPGEQQELWARLDEAARKNGVTLLGTGVNPGFVMDRLVLQLAGACVHVERVKVTRVVDAARRRGPLRKKVGEGLTPAQFQEGVRERRIGHVGLRQSAALIAQGLGWRLEGYDETIEPVVEADLCLGLHQVGRGRVGAREVITLDLTMAVNAESPHDRILLEADPLLDVRIEGGTHGDRGTVGTIVNGVLRASRAPRGLVTVADVFV
jgi:4-hydroxy-tetrahydrodipicolinate reductase